MRGVVARIMCRATMIESEAALLPSAEVKAGRG